MADASTFPIRVIDLEQTLIGSIRGSVFFSKPTSWEFHTISHTWSKDVESWSNIISAKAKSNAEDGGSYDVLFEREDFSRHPGYPPFIEFMRLLKADGVRYAWLDTLCINQENDSGEKSQELQNMGIYYAKSLGCYVCAHGFGEGYETWKEEGGRLVMPRWFTRVWTFQEMLLPKRVTFILYLHPIIRRTINWSISTQEAQGVHGPCRCAMGMRPFPHPRSLYEEEVEEVEEEEEGVSVHDPDRHKYQTQGCGVEIICTGDSLCSQCGGPALIRRARYHRELFQSHEISPAAADLFFIDRECIVRLMIMAKEQLEKTVLKSADERDEPKLIRLETVLQQKQLEDEEVNIIKEVDRAAAAAAYWDPRQVVVEVSRRDCSVPEDRVLSILGLLGVEGAVQLRAGKTLDGQLLDLAQQLIRTTNPNPRTLVNLCIAQFSGYSRPGMSWAPSMKILRPTGEEAPQPTWADLRRNRRTYARQLEVEEGSESGLLDLGRVMRHFAMKVEVQNVHDDGALVFCRANVLWDCWFVRADENLFHLQLKAAAGEPFIPFQAYFSPVSCLLHHGVFVAGRAITLANQSIVRLEGKELNSRLRDFRVHVVFLGELNLPHDEQHQVMMVCVGDHRCLHKVGIAWLPGLEGVFSTNPPSRCTVGGFEDYMERFIFNSRKL